jgi:hypothetical protein
MSPTFDTRSAADVEPLLKAIRTVLDAIDSAGIEAFLAYGTLLGAIREKRFLGHDSDADLAYVSESGHPCDVVRESFRLQRLIHERGFRTHRYSGAAFRVDVVEGDGVVRGLDIFAGFVDEAPAGSRLYLMGEVAADFRREWVYPTTSCTLEGHTFAAPAAPERWLEATYGPSWAIPDPAFQFTTSDRTVRQLSGWFRGTSTNRAAWERTYSGARGKLPTIKPSPLARKAAAVLAEGGTVIDVGAGRGADSLWLAHKGLSVHAYDYVPSASQAVQQVAAEQLVDAGLDPPDADVAVAVLVGDQRRGDRRQQGVGQVGGVEVGIQLVEEVGQVVAVGAVGTGPVPGQRRAGLGQQHQVELRDHQLGQGVEEGPDALARWRPRPQRRRTVEDVLLELEQPVVEEGEHQAGPVAEPAVDGAHPHAGGPGHLVQRQPVGAALGEDPGRGVEDLAAVAGGVGALGRRFADRGGCSRSRSVQPSSHRGPAVTRWSWGDGCHRARGA